MWLFGSKKSEPATVVVDYLKPGPGDVPLTPREAFVSGLNKPSLRGTPRQKVIARCRRGEPIYLVREPQNPYDQNAIRVCRADGDDLGYLPKETAAEIAPRLDKGSPVTAVFGSVERLTTSRGESVLAPRLILTPHRLRR